MNQPTHSSSLADRATATRPEEVAHRAVTILRTWEEGGSWQEALAGDPARGVLQNGLLTLFRKRAFLDWILARFCPRPIRPRLKRLLWWSLAQLFWGHAPAETVADVAVRVAKRHGGAAEAGFINALLRTIIAANPVALLADSAKVGTPAAVRLGLSPELVAAWKKRWSGAELEQIAALLQTPAPTMARRRRHPNQADAESAHDDVVPGLTLLPPCDFAPKEQLFICDNPEKFFADSAFLAGDFYIQDPSTLLAPALLAAQSGETIADLCAAPGGKSLLLAEALRGQGTLFAFDRSAERLERVRQNLAEWQNADIRVADATVAPFPLASGSLDAVLLDVPCSNSGVLRRRPDVRWRFSKASVGELATIQAHILETAAPLVRSGGRLIYSTCSLEPQENDAQMHRFLDLHPEFILETARQLLLTDLHDGAYAARLRRRE